MAVPSVIQRNVGHNAAAANTIPLAYGGSPAAGNALIAICTSQGSLATISAIADTQNLTWNLLPTMNGNSAIKGWIAYNAANSAETVTVTTGFNDSDLYIFEAHNLGPGNAVDALNCIFANQASVTSLSSGNTGTLTYANNLIIGITVNQANPGLAPTLGSGYANLQTSTTAFNGGGSEEKIVSATTAVATTFTVAANSTSHTTAVFVFPDSDVVVLPTVTTQAASSIGKTSATANGNITATGFVNNDHQGVVYDTVSHSLPGNVAPGSSGYASSMDSAGSFGAGAFTESLTGLSKNTTYFYRAYSHNSAGYSYGAEVSFAVTTSVPLIDALSTVNVGFTEDITSVADDKLLMETGSNLLLETGDKMVLNANYPQSDYMTYTVQQSLTPSTQYFWRVRTIYPGGALGPWSETRSFTPTSGGVNATVAQVAATVTAAGGTQAIATVNNVAITQVAATVTATGGTQVVATTRLVAIAQVAATVTAAGGTQAVATINNVSITQVAANVTATGGTQAIATVNNVSVTQVAANVTASGGTQVIATVNNVAITQVAGVVTATGGTQVVATTGSVAIAQVAANVTASGGTQAIATSNFVAIAQLAANVTATGGTQVITTVRIVAIAQVAANVTATGGTQAISAQIVTGTTSSPTLLMMGV